MANDHCIVALIIEFSLRAVGDWDIFEGVTEFQREKRDDGNLLMWNEGCEWVLRLLGDRLYGI